MKHHIFNALLASLLGLTAASSPVHAQAMDPCTVYLCMAGLSGFGASGGAGCTAATTFWHTPAPAGLAVYHPYFNPGASAKLRRSYLQQGCKGSQTLTNATVLNTIITTWGYVP